MTATPILLSDNSSGVEAVDGAAADAVDAASPGSPSFQFYAQVRKWDGHNFVLSFTPSLC